jgi:ubiquinone/menaquinone biosynthesis C-methylase UbiE
MNKVTEYYDATANAYDAMHDAGDPEHVRALERLVPRFFMDARSVLDLGCGTGRALNWFAQNRADMALTGLDPSAKLLEIASRKVPNGTFHQANGEKLPFDDGAFDLVTMTGILHHVEDSKQVIREAFRVARKGVLISDHNNFSFGSDRARRLRLCLYSLGLLPFATFVKQGFRKQGYSEGDGYWYPYSILSDFDVIAENADLYYIVPTTRRNSRHIDNFMMSNSHIAVACLKAPA